MASVTTEIFWYNMPVTYSNYLGDETKLYIYLRLVKGIKYDLNRQVITY